MAVASGWVLHNDVSIQLPLHASVCIQKSCTLRGGVHTPGLGEGAVHGCYRCNDWGVRPSLRPEAQQHAAGCGTPVHNACRIAGIPVMQPQRQTHGNTIMLQVHITQCQGELYARLSGACTGLLVLPQDSRRIITNSAARTTRLEHTHQCLKKKCNSNPRSSQFTYIAQACRP